MRQTAVESNTSYRTCAVDAACSRWHRLARLPGVVEPVGVKRVRRVGAAAARGCGVAGRDPVAAAVETLVGLMHVARAWTGTGSSLHLRDSRDGRVPGA